MSKPCPNCFFDNDDAAATCVVCGAKLPSLGAPTQQLPSGSSRGEVLDAIKKLRLAYLLEIVSVVVYIALGFALTGTFSYSSLVGPLGIAFGGSSQSLSVSTSSAKFLEYTDIEVAASVIIFVATYYLLILSFTKLQRIYSRFSTGRTGALLSLVGLVVIVLSVIGLLAILEPAIVSNSPISNVGALLGLAVLILFMAIIALIGIVMLTIGLFRVGDKFDSTAIKVGSILAIFLGAIGAILIVIGASDIAKRLENEPPSDTEITA
ncbi:MAG TPA: DUF973 family protein [Thermoplasmataceae archaeon]|nr:DUF973 family protein [Thermoplasmataceae archaeon]